MRAKHWLALGFATLLTLGGVAWAAENKCDMANVEKEPYCDKCRKAVEKKEVENGAHKACSGKVTETSFCVKTYYECPTCKKTNRTPMKCSTCNKDMQKKTSKAHIVYRCELCRGSAEAPGKCANPPCKGHTLSKDCELSGTFPHNHDEPKAPTPKSPAPTSNKRPKTGR